MQILEKIKKYWLHSILSLLLSPIGGIIAYFLLRKKDNEAAWLFLYIGIIAAIVGFLINGLI
jgi:glucose uptake protein GlcU